LGWKQLGANSSVKPKARWRLGLQSVDRPPTSERLCWVVLTGSLKAKIAHNDDFCGRQSRIDAT